MYAGRAVGGVGDLQSYLMLPLPCPVPPSATALSSRVKEATGKGSTRWNSCCRRR